MSLNFENVGKEVIYNRSVDNIEDYVKGTIVGCYIGEDEEYYVTSIESSGECIKIYDDSLIEIIEGDSVTPQGIVDATAQMTDEQADDTLYNIGGEPSALYVDVDDTTYAASKSFTTILNAVGANIRVVFRVPFGFAISELTVVGKSASYIVAAATAYINGPVSLCYVLMADESATLYNLPLSIIPETVTVSGATPTITPAANTIYNCGELTSLTVSTIPNTGDFIIRFTSGATATTTNFPASMKFPEAFAPEANTRYEINVSNGYALAVGWPTT